MEDSQDRNLSFGLFWREILLLMIIVEFNSRLEDFIEDDLLQFSCKYKSINIVVRILNKIKSSRNHFSIMC